jgi:uncharacterized ferredoxin-like protein
MPCYPALQRRAAKLQIALPAPESIGTSDQEVRALLGAVDHEDFHRRLDNMTDEEVKAFVKRLLERKRKRAEATANYIAQEARN